RALAARTERGSRRAPAGKICVLYRSGQERPAGSDVPWRSSRPHTARTARRSGFWIRPALPYPGTEQNVRGTDARGESRLQPSGNGVPQAAEVAHRVGNQTVGHDAHRSVAGLAADSPVPSAQKKRGEPEGSPHSCREEKLVRVLVAV